MLPQSEVLDPPGAMANPAMVEAWRPLNEAVGLPTIRAAAVVAGR